ncbi:putative pre-mRNA splicing protein [Podospora appendiculata]|uniref:Pre-mRNA splicing protein n=1 Tax=Podospora appendiculata TaxID=314037 RepID=A0AAE0X8W0_9PEZI|nr:putative pre-mRNA splicing protein [Podospora appendiculata]
MPSDKAAYLAAHYLTADTKPPSSSSGKKRKRKHTSSPSKPSTANSGLIIADDDDDGWTAAAAAKGDDDSDADLPLTIAGTSAEFRRSKKSQWKTVGAPIPSDTKDARDAAAAADAILASAAAETRAQTNADDEAPAVDDGDVAMMNDGTHAGLQSAAALSAQLRRRQKAEREELARMKAERAAAAAAGTEDKDAAAEPELVLRDATGRRVDVSMRRAEARRAEVDAEKAKDAAKRDLKGDVQLRLAKQRRAELQDAALMPLARGKDDVEMNEDMKAAQRWNDPMAEFIEAGDVAGGGGNGKRKGGGGRRPVYKGAAPPNRYGIKPGYRWDGVDRGNGFEAERFKAINRKERVKGLEYAWQMDE